MHTYYALTTFQPLDLFERLIIYTLLIVLLIVIYDVIKMKTQKNRKSKMLEAYLYVRENQWDEIIEILTDPQELSFEDIKNIFEVDISKLDSRYRNILYHELLKIKNYRNVNPKNWRLLIKLIYPSNKKLKKKRVLNLEKCTQ